MLVGCRPNRRMANRGQHFLVAIALHLNQQLQEITERIKISVMTVVGTIISLRKADVAGIETV